MSQDVVAPAIAATEVLDSAHATCGASTVKDVWLSRDADVSKSDEEMVSPMMLKTVPRMDADSSGYCISDWGK
jgi:hypothetical protein